MGEPDQGGTHGGTFRRKAGETWEKQHLLRLPALRWTTMRTLDILLGGNVGAGVHGSVSGVGNTAKTVAMGSIISGETNIYLGIRTYPANRRAALRHVITGAFR